MFCVAITLERGHLHEGLVLVLDLDRHLHFTPQFLEHVFELVLEHVVREVAEVDHAARLVRVPPAPTPAPRGSGARVQVFG